MLTLLKLIYFQKIATMTKWIFSISHKTNTQTQNIAPVPDPLSSNIIQQSKCLSQNITFICMKFTY